MLRLHIGFRQIRNILLYTSSVTPTACHLPLKGKAWIVRFLNRTTNRNLTHRISPGTAVPGDRLFCGVQSFAEDYESLVEVLSDEVGQHRQDQHHIFVPTYLRTGEDCRPPGGQGGEHQIEQGNQRHGYRHISGGVEGELAVEGEIPKHRQHQRAQVAQPMGQLQQGFQQGKADHLDHACADGKQDEFDGTKEFLLCAFHDYDSFNH